MIVWRILSAIVHTMISFILFYGAVVGHNAFGDGYTSFERQMLFAASVVVDLYIARLGQQIEEAS